MQALLLGALVGAVVGAVGAAIMSRLQKRPITWQKEVAAGAGGAVAGAIVVLTRGAALSMFAEESFDDAFVLGGGTHFLGFAISGAAGGAVQQALLNVLSGRNVRTGLSTSTLVGAFLGLLGGMFVGFMSLPIPESGFGPLSGAAVASGGQETTAQLGRWALSRNTSDTGFAIINDDPDCDKTKPATPASSSTPSTSAPSTDGAPVPTPPTNYAPCKESPEERDQKAEEGMATVIEGF
jgi:hypothetical protein